MRRMIMSKNPAKEQQVRPLPTAVNERSADKALLCAVERRLLRLKRGLRRKLPGTGEAQPDKRSAGEE